MSNVTVICYISSLLSYGMGFSKVLLLQNAVTEQVILTDYNTQVSLATSYFVLAIFFAVIGFLFFTLRRVERKKFLKLAQLRFRKIVGMESNARGRASLLEVKSN